jgi:hypothetical protein
VKTARPVTASGGANVGSVDAPGMYGGMRPRLKRNHAAASMNSEKPRVC